MSLSNGLYFGREGVIFSSVHNRRLMMVKHIPPIRKIALEASRLIQKIVMYQAGKVRNKFPTMTFGVRDNVLRRQDIARGMLGDVDVTTRAVDEEMPGIVLWKDDRFWTEASIVVLTPEGIFLCLYVMSKRRVGNICQSQPDWMNRKESPDLWVKYGEQAISELQKLTKK